MEDTRRYVELKFLAGPDEIILLGAALKEACDARGIRFEAIKDTKGNVVYQIVKVKVLGEQEIGSGSSDNGTPPVGEPIP